MYEVKSLFGDMDMGLDFFKQTYGQTAAATWGFAFAPENFVEETVNGRTLSVLRFEGTQTGEPVTGAVVIVPLQSGGHTYSIAYGLPPVFPTLIDDVLAVTASING